jgi:hypothetical protein
MADISDQQAGKRMGRGKKLLLWVGGIVAALWLIGQFAPQKEQPVAAPPPQEVKAAMPLTMPMPVVIGKTGKQGQEEIWVLSKNKRFASIVDEKRVIGCTTLTQASAPIVRTEPMPGTELNLDDASQVITLFVDRSAGPPCPPPPPPAPVNVDPPNVDAPNYDAPNVNTGGGGNGGESRFCRKRWWC